MTLVLVKDVVSVPYTGDFLWRVGVSTETSEDLGVKGRGSGNPDTSSSELSCLFHWFGAELVP